MCGRYTLRRYEFDLYGVSGQLSLPFEEFSERPRFNVAPQQDVAVVRVNAKGERVLGLVRWGLVPSWTKQTPKVQPINARAETVTTSGMFRQALARRRCLVPADGFYEWQVVSPKQKQPFLFTVKNDAPFAFAGIWERWTAPDAEHPQDTMAIITTQANDVVQPVHARMPVILHPSDYATWLDRDAPVDDAAALLRPFPAGQMHATAVSTRVNTPRNDDAGCVKPVG